VFYLLSWLSYFYLVLVVELDIVTRAQELNKMALSNACFAATSVHRVQKKETDYPVNCVLHSVLSCRLREGFTIKEVHLDDEAVEVRLALPWRPAIEVRSLIRFLSFVFLPNTQVPISLNHFLIGLPLNLFNTMFFF